MNPAARLMAHVAMFVLMSSVGLGLWMHHATAWDLGRQSPVLSYDAAQYALAARELALHGRFATTYALPVELAKHAAPPWPLALVQPGLVITEAILFRLTPIEPRIAGFYLGQMRRPDQREWLALALPFICFLLIGNALGLATWRLLRHHAADTPVLGRVLGACTIGIAFMLDPEAQHFAVGGFTELPFTLGLLGATAALAFEIAPRRPLIFGLLLGIAGAFRGNMLWLAPLFMIAAAALAPRERRTRVIALAALGFALPLSPWWIYKWRAFGSPAWDLSRFSIWDGVGGRTWFSLYHLPELPELPTGVAAVSLILAKVARNLPHLMLMLAGGPRALEAGALAIWALFLRGPRALRVAALAALGALALSLVVAAMSEPLLRYVFPTRVAVEAAGILALWALLARAPGLSTSGFRIVATAAALLVLGWGAWQTSRGAREARAVAAERGTPTTLTLLQIATLMNREIPAGEPVMSNLGPALAWEARRPVIHLALNPEAITACRRRMDFHNVLLVFRDVAHVWPEWSEIVAHPLEARHRPELGIQGVRQFDSPDGFIIVWLKLGPLGPLRAGNRGVPGRGVCRSRWSEEWGHSSTNCYFTTNIFRVAVKPPDSSR